LQGELLFSARSKIVMRQRVGNQSRAQAFRTEKETQLRANAMANFPRTLASACLVSAGLVVLAISAAESVESIPNFDVGPTCRGATRPEVAQRNQTGDAAREICIEKEKQARSELQDQWSSFPREHRTSCVRTTSVGGIPSYIQLLTCLETRRAAEKIPDGSDSTTTGQGAPSR
jgi:hypothetical protein